MVGLKIITLSFSPIFCQSNQDSCVVIEECAYSEQYVDVLPTFSFDINEFILSNLTYDELCLEGIIIIKCIVSKNGNTIPLEVIRSLCVNYDNQVFNLLKVMPKGIPASIQGENVSVQKYLSIRIFIDR